MKRYGLIFTEITDIDSQIFMVEQPCISPWGAPENKAAASNRKGVVGRTGKNIPKTPKAKETEPMSR